MNSVRQKCHLRNLYQEKENFFGFRENKYVVRNKGIFISHVFITRPKQHLVLSLSLSDACILFKFNPTPNYSHATSTRNRITRSSYQVQTSQLAVILFQITPFKSEAEVASSRYNYVSSNYQKAICISFTFNVFDLHTSQ